MSQYTCSKCPCPLKEGFDLIYYCDCVPDVKLCYDCFKTTISCYICRKILLSSAEKPFKKTLSPIIKFPPFYNYPLLEFCCNCLTSSENVDKNKCTKCKDYICTKCYDPNNPFCFNCFDKIKTCAECKEFITDNVFKCDYCVVPKIDYFCGKCSLNRLCEHCHTYLNSEYYYQCIRCKKRLHKKNGYRYICSCNSIHIVSNCYPRFFLCTPCDKFRTECPRCLKILNTNNIEYVESRSGLCIPKDFYESCVKEYGYFFDPVKNTEQPKLTKPLTPPPQPPPTPPSSSSFSSSFSSLSHDLALMYL